VPEQKTFPPDLVARLAELAGQAERPIVLIDGGSGSGKSTLADALAARLRAELVHLEDFYPGWGGLELASAHVADGILTSPTPGWRGWDWDAGVSTIWHDVSAALPLVIEGSGALSRRNREAATLGIWLELDPAARRRRALARDGERYAPHWERWAAQENAFADRERPADLADAVVLVASGELVERPA
jgi:energy-coupling factor transporter ATP-binding protein EcfA2